MTKTISRSGKYLGALIKIQSLKLPPELSKSWEIESGKKWSTKAGSASLNRKINTIDIVTKMIYMYFSKVDLMFILIDIGGLQQVGQNSTIVSNPYLRKQLLFRFLILVNEFTFVGLFDHILRSVFDFNKDTRYILSQHTNAQQ